MFVVEISKMYKSITPNDHVYHLCSLQGRKFMLGPYTIISVVDQLLIHNMLVDS